jgi:hypothetical protein
MHRPFFLALLASTLLVAFALPALASTDTQTYAVASPGFSVGVQCNDGCGVTPGSNVGGVRFFATGATPASVVAADDAGKPAYITACQDTNADGTCGGTGEPTITRCGAATLRNFSPARDTVVFVFAYGGLACTSGLSGTVTLTSTP